MRSVLKRTSVAYVFISLFIANICFTAVRGQAELHGSNFNEKNEEEAIDSNIKCSEESEEISSKDFMCPVQKNRTDEKKMGKTVPTESILNLERGFSIKDRIVARYLELLETNALATKCATSGLISLLGDFLAQTFESHQSGSFSFDKLRAVALVFESTFLSGPLMHYAFDYMEYLVPITKSLSALTTDKKTTTIQYLLSSEWGASFIHVAADIIILGPIYVISMMITSALIEGRRKTLWFEFKTDFLPTMWASTLSSVSFLPIQVAAFRMLPVQLRLLYMNMQDIVWNAVVSYYAHRSRVQS